MQRLPWIERTFEFDVPPGWLYNVTARLEGTESRLKDIVRNISDSAARHKPLGKWSIKEHVGHLGDLENLHLQRLGDFEKRNQTLSTWDVTNSATEKANHNDSSLELLIDTFSTKRKLFIQKLRTLDDSTHTFRSLHPRLQVLMKPVDMATFIAEHDDHHIASMMGIGQSAES